MYFPKNTQTNLMLSTCCYLEDSCDFYVNIFFLLFVRHGKFQLCQKTLKLLHKISRKQLIDSVSRCNKNTNQNRTFINLAIYAMKTCATCVKDGDFITDLRIFQNLDTHCHKYLYKISNVLIQPKCKKRIKGCR